MHSLCSEALALLFSMPLQLIFLYNYTLPLIIHIMIRHHLHVTRSCHFLSEIRMTSNNIQYAEVCTGGWTKSECKIKCTLLKPWETYSQIYCAQICSWALPPLHLPRVHSCPHHVISLYRFLPLFHFHGFYYMQTDEKQQKKSGNEASVS